MPLKEKEGVEKRIFVRKNAKKIEFHKKKLKIRRQRLDISWKLY